MGKQRTHVGRFESLSTIALVLLITCTALVIVYNKHWNRELVASIDLLRKQNDFLHEQWSQLLLERGSMTSHSRVEQIAVEQLGMIFPSKKVLVRVAREQ